MDVLAHGIEAGLHRKVVQERVLSGNTEFRIQIELAGIQRQESAQADTPSRDNLEVTVQLSLTNRAGSTARWISRFQVFTSDSPS